MTRAGGADDLYKESLRPLYTRDGGKGGGAGRRHNGNGQLGLRAQQLTP